MAQLRHEPIIAKFDGKWKFRTRNQDAWVLNVWIVFESKLKRPKMPQWANVNIYILHRQSNQHWMR